MEQAPRDLNFRKLPSGGSGVKKAMLEAPVVPSSSRRSLRLRIPRVFYQAANMKLDPLTSRKRCGKTTDVARLNSRCWVPSYSDQTKRNDIEEWLAASAVFVDNVFYSLSSPEPNSDDDSTSVDSTSTIKKVPLPLLLNWETVIPSPKYIHFKPGIVASKPDIPIEIQKIVSATATTSANVGSLITPPTPPVPSNNIQHTPRSTFLASLSVTIPIAVAHPDAQIYKLHFTEKKDELVAKLFKLYNAKLFENKLAADTKITWNEEMCGTAGFCYNRRSVCGNMETRTARIKLSTRVNDRAERLRDSLLHEMCHAAVWVIEGVITGHGPEWSTYTKRVHTVFPDIPPVSSCQHYKIEDKFTYRCVSCGYSVSRQTKSIALVRKRCGHCNSKFELLVNEKNLGKTEVPELGTIPKVRLPNNFNLFVKENYRKVKDAQKGKKHGKIMKIISQQYAIYKRVVTPGKQ